MDTPILIETTFETQQDAENMAASLLEKKLVACAQVSGPLKSLYRWGGKIEHSLEYLLTLKSFEGLYLPIEKVITAEHPYDVPQIIATKVSHAGKSYLSWMDQEIIHD